MRQARLLNQWRLGRKLRAQFHLLRGAYAQVSYAQEGEDRILWRLFGNERRGFYVDIGAHHPVRYSNTYIFYKRGWTGMNIDAAPGSMELFRFLRPRDCNLEVAISEREELKTFYIFDDPALNTFAVENAERYKAHGYKVVAERMIRTRPMCDVLSQHLPEGQKISFLSVDVEGLDLSVLRSNDWTRFRPYCVLAETLGENLEAAMESDVAHYMQELGYSCFAKTANTVFFTLREAVPNW